MRRRLLLKAAAAGALEMHFPVEPMMAIEASAVERLTRAFYFLDEEESSGEEECRDPVRTIFVRGPLVHHASWWWCSYEDTAHEFQEALDDPECEAIVLRIDSPGGYANGMGEAVRQMREAKARAGKPVLAYVDECACSAAYGLATVADEIWLPASGLAGSVGTMLTVYDETKANEKIGLRVEVITSGTQKADGHPDVPLTNATLGRLRERVATLAGLFVGQVADARRMTPDAVAELQAGVFLGQQAIEVGLADRLASLDETLAEAARRGAAAKASRPAPLLLTTGASAPQPKENDMKLLLAKLGLPETASEAEALHALNAQTDVQQKLLSLTGASSPTAALGAVQAWKDGSAQASALKAQLEGVQKAREDAEKADLCNKLRNLGYSKAQVEKLADSMSLDGLRGYASVATPQAHAQEQKEPTGTGSGSNPNSSAPLSFEEQNACAHLGLTEEEFRKEKALSAKGQVNLHDRHNRHSRHREEGQRPDPLADVRSTCRLDRHPRRRHGGPQPVRLRRHGGCLRVHLRCRRHRSRRG